MVVQSGKYPDFRVRNMGTEIFGVPKMLEHTVQEGGLTLGDSLSLDIKLPPFPRFSGKVRNSAEAPVQGVTVSAMAWRQGMTGLPNDESVSGADGAFDLFLPVGTNWIVVRPTHGSPYATTSFTMAMETAPTYKDIYLADQAKGVARVQPSVVSQGAE